MNYRYIEILIIILNDRNFNSRSKYKQFKCTIYKLKKKTNCHKNYQMLRI